MKNEVLAELALSEVAAKLLSAMLDETVQQGGSTDAAKFRALHYDQIDEIESLEATGFIKRVNDGYIVTACALPVLTTETAQQLSAGTERIYGLVREHYKASQAHRIEVEALAREAHLPPVQAQALLTLMLDMPLWCGGWSLNLSEPGGHIIPAEGILKYPTFASIIGQVQKWRFHGHGNTQWGQVGTSVAVTQISAKESAVHQEIARPDWFDSLPGPVSAIMAEVYRGVDLDLRSIAAMGIRAVVDIVLVELVGDIGGFDKKLNAMVDRGLLTQHGRPQMLAVIDAGNAAAHRGHTPDRIDLLTLLRVCENLLYEHLIMPNRALRLRSNTPARPKP
jgi:hypothetical protein